MENHQKCLDFTKWFEDTINVKPGMIGSVAELSAMFYVIDNVNSLLLFGEALPRELSWHSFLFNKKLFRDLKQIPIEDNWDYDKFIDLRHQYLQWLENSRKSINFNIE